MKPIVIVGSGLAGYTTARELRKLDKERPLLVVTADAGHFYSKPMLSNAYASGKTAEQLASGDAAQMAEQLGATIRPHARVSAIDANRHVIHLDDEELEYERLVLALGADPIRLPIEGDGAADIYSINDLAGYARFRAGLQDARRVLIMGAGLIGCEFANDLRTGGLAVDVVDPSPLPLGRLLPPPAGEALRAALAGLGVGWHLGKTVRSVERSGQGYAATLSDGASIQADAVLSAVGLRPRTELAAQAGLAVSRGIVVDRHLETGISGIYALGDCAEVEGLVLPFVMPIMHAARALAKSLSGTRTAAAYPAMPVVVKTPACPVVISPPPQNVAGEWRVDVTDGGVRALFEDDQGQLLGFALTGVAVREKQALTMRLPAVLP